MNKTNTVLHYLKQNTLDNINEIGFIENNHISDVEIVGSSVLIRGTSDRNWVYISCANNDDLQLIKDRLTDKDQNFGAIDNWIVPHLLEGKTRQWKLECEQFYLPNEINLPKPIHDTSALSLEDVDAIYNNSTYQQYISKEYIADRIKNGVSAGVYENDLLVAWGMTQDDGGLGFLHVLDDHRRKGYGLSVTLALIDAVRKNGKIPFTYLEEDNVRSKNLVNKLGFKPLKKIQWFQII